MPDEPELNPEEIRRAFHDYERLVRVRNYKVGCVLALIFMPAGAVLDYFVYREQVTEFFLLRLLCSVLLAAIWCLLHFRPEHPAYRGLGFSVALLPMAVICWMIYSSTDGANSPYYAGLTLVFLGATILLRWTVAESILLFVLTGACYLLACVSNRAPWDPRAVFNNFYFLFVTGVFIVTGTWFYNQLRFREFELRYQLDANRRLLEASYAKLRELDEAKSRFFANISHELRTPLTLLLAPVESLLTRHRATLETETQDLLHTMQANGMRLLKLINDLLDLSKLDARQLKLQPTPVAVEEFLRGLLSAVQRLATDKGLRLDCSVAAEVGTISADRDKLEKVFLNLLFNAVKFTGPGGRISVKAEREGEELVVRVADTGMGIADSHLPFIFDRFWQADSSAQRKFQGTGIGLALVKELVEAHGGTVTAQSQLGVGTTMLVRLPYARGLSAEAESKPQPESETSLALAAHPQLVAQREEWLANLYRRAELFPAICSPRDTVRPDELPASNGKPRVLIADDEPDMLRFLRSQLAPHFQVLEAVDGQQALEKANQFLPDLVVCDMMMPEKDGLQVCRELRAKVATQNIPFVLLTARADEETKLAALTAGASDFLTKPFSTTELHVRLNNLIESHRLHQQLAWQNRKLEATLEQLKETELQLVQSEKLASLGRMSAGIIHEINNPLNYTKTGLYALRAKGRLLPQEQRPDFDDLLRDIEDGVNRVQNIVSDLRTFTHPKDEAFDEVAVEELVSTALRFLSHEWTDRVRIEQDIPADHSLRAHRNRLVQVLVNLFENALDALHSKPRGEDPPTIWVQSRLANGQHTLVIRDNGPGIAPEHLDKIFEPFFTTKEVGDGMGLGLSICYRIVEEHGGRIRVKSEPGKFCEFTLEFPVSVSSCKPL
jgi:signal transduction histidine kinase